jgi:hypothetical protein
MANNCWNHVYISGSKEVIDRLQELFKSKAQDESFATFADRFFPEPCEDYGSRWWEFWLERNEDNSMTVLGDSAWCPPHEFLQMLSDHYPVKITAEYEERGQDFGGTTTYEAGEVDDTCYTYLEWCWVSSSEQFWEEVLCYVEQCENFAEFKTEYLDKFYTKLTKKELKEIKEGYNLELNNQ